MHLGQDRLLPLLSATRYLTESCSI